jgi:hypothetical protein
MNNDTDISELLKGKAARRRSLARLSFEEKIKIVRRLQKLSLSIKNRRTENKGARRTRKSAAHR